MIRKLIAWSLDNPLIVLMLALGLVAYGLYSFKEVNVEAYPDPAPAIIEVIAQFPGASAEEVERLVTAGRTDNDVQPAPGRRLEGGQQSRRIAVKLKELKVDVSVADHGWGNRQSDSHIHAGRRVGRLRHDGQRRSRELDRRGH